MNLTKNPSNLTINKNKEKTLYTQKIFKILLILLKQMIIKKKDLIK